MIWEVEYTKQAIKDIKKIKQSTLKCKAREIIDILIEDPFQNPPPYEKLSGNLSGFYSRRINIQHRLIYQVYPQEKIVQIHRMWTHYE